MEKTVSHCKVIKQNTKTPDNEKCCGVLLGFHFIIHYMRTEDDHDNLTAKQQPYECVVTLLPCRAGGCDSFYTVFYLRTVIKGI
jgi:hypothetical protein